MLSARDPLSLPITSNNFKRFVARAGFVFWRQDRVEEVIMWRRGTSVTSAWLAAYGFLCKVLYILSEFLSIHDRQATSLEWSSFRTQY